MRLIFVVLLALAGCTVHYSTCDEAPGPILEGEPGYSRHLDRNRDGVACEAAE